MFGHFLSLNITYLFSLVKYARKSNDIFFYAEQIKRFDLFSVII